MERDFKGVWIPKEIWLNKELTLQEKVMLVEIDSLDNEDGCFASNKYFADFFELSITRISHVISNLVNKGWLDVTYEKNGKQIIRRIMKIKRPPYPAFDTYCVNSKGGIADMQGEYCENSKDNNTSINNTNISKKENILKERFKKPTLEEVQTYCLERNNNINAELFIDYYESNGWKVGKNSMKDWKAAVRTWEKKNSTKVDERQKRIEEWLKNE